MVTLRAQLAGKHINVIELAPPLNAQHRGRTREAPQPMPLDEYMATLIKGFETDGMKETATGFSEISVKTWRGQLGPIFEDFRIDSQLDGSMPPHTWRSCLVFRAYMDMVKLGLDVAGT